MATTTSESEAEIFVPSHNEVGTEYDKDAPEPPPTIDKGEAKVGTMVTNENRKMVLKSSDLSIPEVVRASYAANFGPTATASQGADLMNAASVAKSANVEADVIKATRESPPGFATNLEDIASSLEIPQAIPLRVGLEGDPGIGKTLFCQRMALRWTLGMLDNYDLVLMVDVSSVTTSLCDYLYGEHFGSDSFTTPDAFWDYVANHQESVLLLVDGLEILTQKQLHNLGFYDIFVGGALERSHVVITARSGLRTTTLMKVCDFVYILQGPTTVAKVDYVRSYFVEKTSLAERLVAEIETNPQLLELASNPSCLALLCHLQVGQDSRPFRLPTTVTELYTEVFQRLLLSPCSTKPYILEGERMWKDIHLRLMALGQIAWEELKCNRTTFSVHNLRDTYKVLDRLLPLGVLRIEQQYERGVHNELMLSQKCSFINRTWQEYFAAFYVGEKAKSQPNSRQTTQYLQACLERDNSLVCLFTAGHMKSKASPLIRTIEREIKFYRKEIERVPKSREAELRLTDLLRMGLECLQECRAQTNFVHILAQFFTEKLHITEKCTAASLYSIADVLKFQGAQKSQKDQVFVNTLQISVAGRLTARLPMFFDALDRDLRIRSLVFEDNLNLSSARSCGGSISMDCRSLRRFLQRHRSIDEVSCNIDNITISRPAFGAIIDAMTASRSLCCANFKILYDYDSKFAEEFCSLPFEALAVSSLQEFSLELEESCFSQVENESTAENRLSLMSPVVRMLQTSPQMRKMSITIEDTEVHSEKPATRAYTLQVIPLLQAVAGERTLQEFSLQVPRADILILTGTRDLVTRNVVLKKFHLTASETSTPRETTAVSEILQALTNNRSLQCFSLQLEDVPPSCNPNELLRDVTEVVKTNPTLRTFSFVIHKRPLGDCLNMECPSCGEPVKAKQKFCHECGTGLQKRQKFQDSGEFQGAGDGGMVSSTPSTEPTVPAGKQPDDSKEGPPQPGDRNVHVSGLSTDHNANMEINTLPTSDKSIKPLQAEPMETDSVKDEMGASKDGSSSEALKDGIPQETEGSASSKGGERSLPDDKRPVSPTVLADTLQKSVQLHTPTEETSAGVLGFEEVDVSSLVKEGSGHIEAGQGDTESRNLLASCPPKPADDTTGTSTGVQGFEKGNAGSLGGTQSSKAPKVGQRNKPKSDLKASRPSKPTHAATEDEQASKTATNKSDKDKGPPKSDGKPGKKKVQPDSTEEKQSQVLVSSEATDQAKPAAEPKTKAFEQEIIHPPNDEHSLEANKDSTDGEDQDTGEEETPVQEEGDQHSDEDLQNMPFADTSMEDSFVLVGGEKDEKNSHDGHSQAADDKDADSDSEEWQKVENKKTRRQKKQDHKNRKQPDNKAKKEQENQSHHTSSPSKIVHQPHLASQYEGGSTMTLHFHVLVSPDFKMKPDVERVHVRSDIVDWKSLAVLEITRHLKDGFLVAEGKCSINLKRVNNRFVSFKYAVVKENGDVKWEFIHYSMGGGVIVNRCFKLLPEQCQAGGDVHLYNDAMQVELGRLDKFKSLIGWTSVEEKVAHDRRIAVQAWLPRWKGFTCDQQGEELLACDVMKQVQAVCHWVGASPVSDGYYNRKRWELKEFSISKVLMEYIGPKLDQLAKTKEQKTESPEAAQARIVSALSICWLVHKYQLPLSEKQAHALFEGLLIRPDVKDKSCREVEAFSLHFCQDGRLNPAEKPLAVIKELDPAVFDADALLERSCAAILTNKELLDPLTVKTVSLPTLCAAIAVNVATGYSLSLEEDRQDVLALLQMATALAASHVSDDAADKGDDTTRQEACQTFCISHNVLMSCLEACTYRHLSPILIGAVGLAAACMSNLWQCMSSATETKAQNMQTNMMKLIEKETSWVIRWLGKQLHARISFGAEEESKISTMERVELFCSLDTSTFPQHLAQCFSDAAFDAVDNIVKSKNGQQIVASYTRSPNESKYKYGGLFSRMLCRTWPATNQGRTPPTNFRLLQHMLTWQPCAGILKLFGEASDLVEVLNEDSQTHIAFYKSLLGTTIQELTKATIIIGHLQLLLEHKKQFLELCSAVAVKGEEEDKTKKAKGNGKHDTNMVVKVGDSAWHVKQLEKVLDWRGKELAAIKTETRQIECFLGMCEDIKPVACEELEQKVRRDTSTISLNNLCQAVTGDDIANVSFDLNQPPNITYFGITPEFREMLSHLEGLSKSTIFNKIWEKMRQTEPDEEEEAMPALSVDDVLNQVWKPAYQKWLELRQSVKDGNIKLQEVDETFGQFKNKNLENEMKMLAKNPREGWIKDRVLQIQQYHQLNKHLDAADVVKDVKEKYDLKGDFKGVEVLLHSKAKNFKQNPLSSINKKVVNAGKLLAEMTEERIESIRMFVKCQRLVDWLRTKIHDTKELKVFVDLASISAGESDIEVDKVNCLLSAGVGYAPLIYDLKEESDFDALMKCCRHFWTALEKDKHLPKKLMDTTRNLEWLKGVSDSHGSVEMSSLSQTEAINARGVYEIGCFGQNQALNDLESVVRLRVEGAESEEADDEDMAVKELKEYNLSMLKSLQSKLMLLAGKADKGSEEVDRFVEILTGVTRLGQAYVHLYNAGAVLFNNWNAVVYCEGNRRVKVMVNFGFDTPVLYGTRAAVEEQLTQLAKYMEVCLEEWLGAMDKARLEYDELNHFTTEQIVVLRKALAKMIDPSESVSPQVLALLSSIKPLCAEEDIRRAMAHVAGDIDAMEEENINEEPEMEEAVKKMWSMDDEEREEFVEKLKQMVPDLTDRVAMAAMKATKGNVEEAVGWCISNMDDDDFIDQVLNKEEEEEEEEMVAAVEDVIPEMVEDSSIMLTSIQEPVSLAGFTSMSLSRDLEEPRKETMVKKMESVWAEYLTTVKSTTFEEYISIDHLALVLRNLSSTANITVGRQWPSRFLEAGKPNLVVCPQDDIWQTVLFLYMQGQTTQSLPSYREVLICTPHTTLEEVVLLWRRAVGDQTGGIFCLVAADQLDYDVSVRAEEMRCKLFQGKSGYHVVVVCASERQHQSYMVTALDQYKVPIPHVPSPEHVQEYLLAQFQQPDAGTALMASAVDHQRLVGRDGAVWRRLPWDLYVVEHTYKPQAGLRQVDDGMFRSVEYQRPYQYLRRWMANTNLDTFVFTPGHTEGSHQNFLHTVLSYCGMEDPSWAELLHFLSFLNYQLQDYEHSAFCLDFLRDTLPGFRKFVVQFMIIMSKDFATPSLNMSDQSPSLKMAPSADDQQQEEIQQFQLRRTWETSPHPYLFFNADHNSMTFLGFYVDRAGSVIDATGQLLEQNVITANLYQGLTGNGVKFNANFDDLTRFEKIQKLCFVMGIHDVFYDPDPSYELTTDNVKKILAIQMRFRCNIPVIIMGETGCGKTRLIRFMCDLQAGHVKGKKHPENMIIMKVHGGVRAEDIIRKVERAQQTARLNRARHNIDTVLFFDEANTTEAIGLIKEIMCDGTIAGQPLNRQQGCLKIVAAINPYRRHTDDMIRRLEEAGLGYHIKATETKDRFGHIPLRQLVYRVQPLPPSMLPLVWDFGQLSSDVEEKYIVQMVNRCLKKYSLTANSTKVVSAVLAASQRYMRSKKDECSFVSLRDAERTLTVLCWFYQMSGKLRDLMPDTGRSTRANAQLSDFTRALVLAIGVCYHSRLETRKQYRRDVAKYFTEPCQLPQGPQTVEQEIDRCQDAFLDELKDQLGANIACNTALKENVFMMVVCIELQIPLFLVGKPGSSKSLAKTIVADAMQGDSAPSALFKGLKQAQMVSFQCSPLATPEGIVGTFRQCSKFQKDKDLSRFVSVVVLDEVGLAEDSPKMPLKTLHPLLEDGYEEEDQEEEDEEDDDGSEEEEDRDPTRSHKKVAFVGISNWALDPAKMNRGIFVSRGKPRKDDLTKSARGICENDNHVLARMKTLLPHLSEAYLQLYNSQDREFFGLRDFYSLVKMVYGFCKTSERPPTKAQVVHAVLRNYGGRDDMDPLQKFGQVVGTLPDDKVCRNINRIKVCMETGRTVVLLNLENLYESLYDALNQYYVYFGGQRYVDLGLGTHRVKCRVHQNFRLVVVAEKDIVYERFPIPLINRLEKHFLAISTVLTPQQKAIAHRLEGWAEAFATRRTAPHETVKHQYTVGDAFIGYHPDTAATLVFQVCSEMGGADTDDPALEEEILQNAQDLLLQCATPDAVVRLSKSRLSSEEAALNEKYFHQQHHSCLQEFLCHRVDQARQAGGLQQGIQTQVTTHSKLLSHTDAQTLATALGLPPFYCAVMSLQQFDTEHQFCKQIRGFLTDTLHQESVLIVQCDSGHTNSNLIACARYCVQDEQTQVGNTTAHLVFIVQLPRLPGGCFVGFQGGKWTCAHIDDLQPPQKNAPDVAQMRGKPISQLLGGHRKEEETGSMDGDAEEEGNMADGSVQMEEEEAAPSTKADVDEDMDVDVDVDVNDELQGSAMEEEGGDTQEGMDLEDIELDLTAEDEEIEPKPKMTDKYTEASVLDDKMLLVSCIQAAAAMLEDPKDLPKRRTVARIEKLMQLLLDRKDTGLSFCDVVKARIVQLLEEKEKSKADGGVNWLTNEAATHKAITEAGTLRQSAWNHLSSVIAPLLAEIVAYADRNCNLDHMATPAGEWAIPLFLAVLNDHNLVPFHYNDMLSPLMNVQRQKIPVLSSGCGEQLFECRVPFSWVIRGQVDAMWKAAQKLEASTGETPDQALPRLFEESMLGRIILRAAKQDHSGEDIAARYLHDFVWMNYRMVTTDVEEIKLVCSAVEMSARELHAQSGSEEPFCLTIPAIHTAFSRVQGRLHNLSQLLETTPGLLQQLGAVDFESDTSMTVDTTAVLVVLEGLTPEAHDVTTPRGRQSWLGRMQCVAPVVERVFAAAASLDNSSCYGEKSLTQVHVGRFLWIRLQTLQMFMEHMFTAADGEESLNTKQMDVLWKVLSNEPQNDFKSVKTMKKVERFLKSCNSQAGIKHFREAVEKHNAYRRCCNSFFMELVSRFCFADGTPPEAGVVEMLLNYVVRREKEGTATQTKKFTPFEDDCIDQTPVIRSFLLQLLLRANSQEVIDHMEKYLQAARRFVLDKQEVIELLVIFIQCMEDSYKQEAAQSHDTETAMIEVAMSKLQQAGRQAHVNAPGLSVATLLFIANIRFGLSVAAQLLHKYHGRRALSVQEELKLGSWNRHYRLTKRLLDQAWRLCEQLEWRWPQVFLLKQLYRSCGMDSLLSVTEQAQLHQHLQWVIPPEARGGKEEIIPDRFIMCGDQYRQLREELAKSMVSKNMEAVDKVLQAMGAPENVREVQLLLALYREVTVSRANSNQARHPTQDYITVSHQYLADSPVLTNKQLAMELLTNNQGGGNLTLTVTPNQPPIQRTLSALVIHTAAVLGTDVGGVLLPLQTLLQNPQNLAVGFIR
uniref:AAA+ ATPase domain-containing protein n=1 Tax=Branchiostoma floridae TaxID=7739 RepID=C3YWC5_BRAFL|eukprot:XP_002599157.1 hypothetical protein BRAFLDRAFT_68766 [Branchiostoma floridae]